MKIHLEKNAIRAMGVAECYLPISNKSTLCSVVMRSDLVIDGCNYGLSTVGGDDITDGISLMYKQFHRNDINVILILGSIMSSYNVVDIHYLFNSFNLPIISVSLNSPKNLENNFKRKHSTSWKNKLLINSKNGDNLKINLTTKYFIHAQICGISKTEAQRLLNKFTLQGSIPEPLRIAKLFARAKVLKPVS